MARIQCQCALVTLPRFGATPQCAVDLAQVEMVARLRIIPRYGLAYPFQGLVVLTATVSRHTEQVPGVSVFRVDLQDCTVKLLRLRVAGPPGGAAAPLSINPQRWSWNSPCLQDMLGELPVIHRGFPPWKLLVE